MICVPVLVVDGGVEDALPRAVAAKAAGASLVEWRVDAGCWADAGAVARLVGESALPSVVTCRSAREGGQYDLDAHGVGPLVGVIDAAVTAGAAYVDVEHAAYLETDAMRRAADALAGGETRLILSMHDFDGRPADLTRRVAAMTAVDACRVVKAAWRARSIRDNAEALELTGTVRAAGKQAVMLCMGEAGLASRALAGTVGGLMTFGTLDDPSQVTAPGQPAVRDLLGSYRVRQQSADTRVYGVIGWPVGHSLSPAIHNAGFAAVGHDGVYLPLPVADSDEAFKASVGAWLDASANSSNHTGPMRFRGASVTLPHKARLLTFVEQAGGTVEPLAAAIGAANTLVVDDAGQLHASNTDYAAILDAVCDTLAIDRVALANKTVGVLGAGGAARAAVAGFAACGAAVTVYNRTAAKAQALADAFDGTPGPVTAAALDNTAGATQDVWVQCTSVGMHPAVDACPIGDPPPAWGPGTLVFDTIYNPAETVLLRRARAAGCATIPGIEMFVRQAAAQFAQWTGHPPPLDTFRSVCAGVTPRASASVSDDSA